jgi:hypothetical protein
VTANDVDDADTGPNQLQNFPEMTAAVLSGGTLTSLLGAVGVAPNSAYPLSVEFFLADVDGQEGQTYLGTHSYMSRCGYGGASAGGCASDSASWPRPRTPTATRRSFRSTSR